MPPNILLNVRKRVCHVERRTAFTPTTVAETLPAACDKSRRRGNSMAGRFGTLIDAEKPVSAIEGAIKCVE